MPQARSSAMLIVTMEPPADLEDEFNDWYDLEHFPQRAALPGFGACSRWVCLEGWPRYLALYDLETAAALETPEYLAVSGEGATPWSRRVLPRTLGRLRVVAESAAEAGATGAAPGEGRIARLLAARYPQPGPDAARALLKVALPGLAGTHCLRAGADLWLLARFDRPVLLPPLIDAFGTASGVGASLFNLYVPYLRGP